MYLKSCFILFLGVVIHQFQVQASNVQRGAQIRVTRNAITYITAFVKDFVETKLPSHQIPDQAGCQGPICFRASNIKVVQPKIDVGTVTEIVPNRGLDIRFKLRFAEIQVQLWVELRRFIRYTERSILHAQVFNVNFHLAVGLTSVNGKPQVRATSCSASIYNLQLQFWGGCRLIHHLLNGLLKRHVIRIVQQQICSTIVKDLNGLVNQELAKIPTQLNILNMAYLDISLKQFIFNREFIDALIQGEFLEFNRHSHSVLTPPDFDTGSLSENMVYLWVSEYTLNTLGEVIHNAHLLPKMVDVGKFLPPLIKEYLDTGTLHYIIPALYYKYPDRPLQISLDTTKAPVFDINQGKASAHAHLRANVNVVKEDESVVKVFHYDVDCDVDIEASLKTVDQLKVFANIPSIECKFTLGGSTIGDFSLPVGSNFFNGIIKGVVNNKVNPVITKGIPIPQSPYLTLLWSNLIFERNAVRIGTDFKINLK